MDTLKDVLLTVKVLLIRQLKQSYNACATLAAKVSLFYDFFCITVKVLCHSVHGCQKLDHKGTNRLGWISQRRETLSEVFQRNLVKCLK